MQRRFSLSWWAYTFPMTGAAIAAIEYVTAAPSWITRILAIMLSIVASCTVCGLFISTLLHTFVWNTLFQNDNAIAITARGTKETFSFEKATAMALNMDVFTLENEPLHKIVLHQIHHLLSSKHYPFHHKHSPPCNPPVSVSVSIPASDVPSSPFDASDTDSDSDPVRV